MKELMKELKEACKIIRDNTECTCKLTGSMYCSKHNTIEISKEQRKLIWNIFGF